MNTAGFRLGCVLLLASLLAACIAPNKDYVDAKSLKPITLIDGANGERLGELYPVPDGENQRLQTNTPLPPVIGVQSSVAATAFNLGERYWVLNNQTPATTWSQLIEFWESEGIAVLSQDVNAAVMETEWFTEAIQPSFEVRYQLALTRGLQFDTVEIHLINQVRAIGSASDPWPSVADNPNHSQWLISRLEPFLNNRTNAINNTFLASTLNLPTRVVYRENTQEPVLTIDIDADRVQPTFQRALRQLPTRLYDTDSSRNIFHFNIIEENRSSFLGRLNPFSSSEPLDSPYNLSTILSNLDVQQAEVAALFDDVVPVNNPQRLTNIPGYLLVVSDTTLGDKQVIVRDGYGEFLPLAEAQTVINAVRRQLR